MKIGTKSVLYGAHCFAIHPWFVAAAWAKIYGFPLDPRLWCAFFLHDLGYFGKPNLDGEEGETHPELGARIMWRLFDVEDAFGDLPDQVVQYRWRLLARACDAVFGDGKHITGEDYTWCGFTRYHSRYLSKSHDVQPSKLCVADKLAIALTPAWLYLPMVRATGELAEYRKNGVDGAIRSKSMSTEERAAMLGSDRDWYLGVQAYCRRWVEAHKDGAEDTWTRDRSAERKAVG